MPAWTSVYIVIPSSRLPVPSLASLHPNASIPWMDHTILRSELPPSHTRTRSCHWDSLTRVRLCIVGFVIALAVQASERHLTTISQKVVQLIPSSPCRDWHSL
ncbi:hypothetical protein K432DRAFT_237254 [Lepidopterella palustris CBS 459.81]|uniref:Uncharacterized protein n=1 Tax=Lepidopterella palustris CBS 459.81 TaxID=1314670 RepID=A0A8E2EDR8_9PEZI|nr:hypothetical protein K432DRAFT_237254 [Lepidopterella palustris CBS 459.81]